MTPCASQLRFGFLGGREVVGRFDGGRLSSDGGLALLAQVGRRCGLAARLVRCLQDRRQAAKVCRPPRP